MKITLNNGNTIDNIILNGNNYISDDIIGKKEQL